MSNQYLIQNKRKQNMIELKKKNPIRKTIDHE